ncbi:very short patch repair endonuclease [Phycicoccus sp. 3266]|uniref:very short patch repair endonuclease n=1 Tax=Phycicoccus sp. 3266 TaxID=2817751 RepID=UPI00286CF5D8|nr:very short patch repair endonuclease [Phycicoccus sp. 3266]
MSTLARRDTAPEMVLRRALFASGRRYRVQYRVPGLARRRVDVAFPRRRLAVFVDGCFWHGCPIHCHLPATNPDWWQWKLDRNLARDRDTDFQLDQLGWRVVRVWEHESAEQMVEKVEVELARS